jgi:DNA-binding MarR family transcriptional regulator
MNVDGVGPMSLYRNAVEERYGSGDRYEVALHLMATGRVLAGTIDDVLKEYGLTPAQWSVLAIIHLAEARRIPFGRIAQALDVHGTTVTNAVDRLTDLGLVERSVDPQDRRSVSAETTPEGAARADKTMQRLADLEFGLSALSEPDLTTLMRILGKLNPLP